METIVSFGSSGLTGRTELGAESHTAFLNVSKQLSAILCKKKKNKKKNSCSAVCGTLAHNVFLVDSSSPQLQLASSRWSVSLFITFSGFICLRGQTVLCTCTKNKNKNKNKKDKLHECQEQKQTVPFIIVS